MDRVEIQSVLTDILESPEFKEAQRYRELLQYLVEESLEDRVPKETTIGMRFFGKDATFNSKEDATVRVYINNLRKKLEHYYYTSEKPHTHKLCIPVGHYKVEFVPIVKKRILGRKGRRLVLSVFITSLTLISFLLGVKYSTYLQSDRQAIEVPNSIWNDFVRTGGRPTLFVLGDYYFLRDQTAPVSTYYRTITINTPEDYQQAIAKNPSFAARYKQNNFTFIRPSAPLGIAQILPIVHRASNGYSIKLASQFTDNDFKTNNIIFIGSFKTLYSFKKFLHTFRVEYSSMPEAINILGEGGDSLCQYSIRDQRGEDFVKDFSVIARGAGPEGSTILLLIGFHETGVIAATHAACDNSLINAIQTKFPLSAVTEPFYFTLVLSTEGLTDAIFNYDIRHFLPNKPLHSLSNIGENDSLHAK
ncbi:MAG: hypothetical protein V1799_13865 [bacterium]